MLLGIRSLPYAIKFHVAPLVEWGLITLSLPKKPKTVVYREIKVNVEEPNHPNRKSSLER